MYGSHEEIPLHDQELLKELFNTDDLEDVSLDEINALRSNNSELFENEEPYEELDGDLESGLTSVGWGTDEDYGLFTD